MQSYASTGHPDLPRHPTPKGELPWEGFTGFGSLKGNFTMVPNEIWTLQMPGLTPELRWTLVSLTRETVGEAYRRGGSPYDFASISWSRWMKVLEVKDRNTARARLARLEEMGLIEVQPGDQGNLGSTANAYRLRWANGGQPVPRTLDAVVQRRQRDMDRKQESRREEACFAEPQGGAPAHPPLPPGVDPAHPPRRPPPGGVRRTPPGGGTAHPPSFKYTEYIGTTFYFQSVSPSFFEENELTDRLTGTENLITNKFQSVMRSALTEKPVEMNTEELTDEIPELNTHLRHWLRSAGGGPWPEPLLSRLAAILDPPQVAGIAGRSPWSAEGASAILDAIQAKGRKLGNQAGTLWNALLQPGKGAAWLARAASPPGQAGWKKASGDGVTVRVPCDPIRIEPDLYDDISEPQKEEPMPDLTEITPLRPQELSADRKAELRDQVEAFRRASRALLRPQATKEPDLMEAFSQTWDSLMRSLEPLLPIQVTLPDQYRPTEIRRRSQIKTNVVAAVYDAIS